MSRARVAVLQVVSQQKSVTQAAAVHGYSRRQLTRLIALYRHGGLDALEPRSRRPHSNPNAVEERLRDRVIDLRRSLTADGLDAGPETIAWHLERAGLRVLSTSTIRRILHHAALIEPEPRKRPRSSYIRFEAAQPNETWQSDFMHTRLLDGTDVEVLSWLDDHSRYLLSCSAHTPVTGDVVVSTFLKTVEQHGTPASTLTDNGRVYTARFGGGRNAFEHLLPLLGVCQKNGSPGHPQTQGKIERFHQTLQRWLRVRPPARSVAELQAQIDRFREHYNEQRPHRALGRRTPAAAYRTLPKAAPADSRAAQHYRIRYDRLDAKGTMTLRHAGRLRHLPAGIINARTRVLALADDHQVLITNLSTGEVLSRHLIDPDKGYWRNQNKEPGRWPSPPN